MTSWDLFLKISPHLANQVLVVLQICKKKGRDWLMESEATVNGLIGVQLKDVVWGVTQLEQDESSIFSA